MGVKNLRNKKQQGFTLIELLVVIAIIGLLASVVLLALNSARAKSRDAKRVADVRQMQSALELYFNDCNSYPAAATAQVIETMKLQQGTAAVSGGNCTGTTGFQTAATATSGTAYITSIPVAPLPADNPSGSSTCTATNNKYTYTAAAVPNSSYTLTFCLGGTTGGLGSGTHTASESGMQ